MKFFILSDIHGSASAFERAAHAFEKEGADYLVVCGDYLNHGPRNPIPEGYDPSDRDAVVAYLRTHQAAGAIPTGLLYLDAGGAEMHEANRTPTVPLAQMPYESLCPGARALDALQASYR